MWIGSARPRAVLRRGRGWIEAPVKLTSWGMRPWIGGMRSVVLRAWGLLLGRRRDSLPPLFFNGYLWVNDPIVALALFVRLFECVMLPKIMSYTTLPSIGSGAELVIRVLALNGTVDLLQIHRTSLRTGDCLVNEDNVVRRWPL